MAIKKTTATTKAATKKCCAAAKPAAAKKTCAAAKAPVKKPIRAKKAAVATAPKKTVKPAVKKATAVVLTIQAEVGSKVFLAGTFNDWNPTALEMVDKDNTGLFSTTLKLAKGIYEYKFVVNGTWTLDPDPDRDWTQNGLGTLNSVLRVGE